MLKRNQSKIQQLTPRGIWLFIIGRVFVAFALGVYAMQYYPEITDSIKLPILIIGLVTMIIAFKEFAGSKTNSAT